MTPSERLVRLTYIARLFVWAARTGHPGATEHYLDLWLHSKGSWDPERYPEREALEERGPRNEDPVRRINGYLVEDDPFKLDG